MIEDLEILNPLGKSDHGVLSFTYLCYGEEKIIKGIPKYYKGDYEGMREYLSQQNREFEVVNVTWKRFHSAIMTGTNKFIPCFKPGSKKRQSWIDTSVLEKIKMKHRAWNKYKRNATPENWDSYTMVRNSATWEVKTAKQMHERSIAMNIKRNPKCFWNMVGDKTQVRQGVSDLKTIEGDTVTDDIEKANLLNSFFASVFTQENISIIPRMPDRKIYNILNEVSINEGKVKEILVSLKIDKSPGPDGIHNRVRYENREQILVPLTETFRNSFETGK